MLGKGHLTAWVGAFPSTDPGFEGLASVVGVDRGLPILGSCGPDSERGGVLICSERDSGSGYLLEVMCKSSEREFGG